MQVHDSLSALVGNTPLVRLRSVTRGIPGANVLAKVEYFNPGGSVKDRIALRMVAAAEDSGALRPGGTIVEPTSGNTGVGLAIVAAERGYRCVFVCPDKVAQDKIAVLRAYGAEVVVCPGTVAPDHPDSYYSVARRLAAETPGGWQPDQYANQENPASHYATTGPEIWTQTDGTVTHFVAGIGTGGTITGTGRYLKEVSGGAVRVIGADPEGSVYSGGSGRPYLVEGVGEDIWPATYDPSVCDEIIAISDAESFGMTRRLAREEALLAGGSSGLAVAAALRVAEAAGPDAVIVVLLPDGGRGYLSKIFNDEWMADYGFLSAQTSEPLVADVMARKERSLPEFVHVHPEENVGRGHRAAARVRRVPAARGQGGAAGDGRRSGRLGGGARSARRPGGRPGEAVRPGGRAHVGAAADRRPGRAGVPGGPRAGEGGRGARAREREADRAAHPAGHAHLPGREQLTRRRKSLMTSHDGFETLAIHAGQEPDPVTGAVVPPIYQVSTYKQDGVGGLRGGYEYSRSANPTRTALEQCLTRSRAARGGSPSPPAWPRRTA